MVQEFVAGTFRQTNLTNESEDYLAKREELRLAEIELLQHQERVSALRRELPQGAVVKDYEFLEGPANLGEGDEPVRTVKLSQLFTPGNRPLVIYHQMFGKAQMKPCPMCTMWVDGFNGVAQHLVRNIDFAIVVAAEPKQIREYARGRGWDNLRLLSAGTSTFKYDLGSEDEAGAQDSTISVFTKDEDGTVRHFYSAHPRTSPEAKERGLDLLSPVWNMMDLTPQGRGTDWYPSIAYGATVKKN
jgi:predicted dithiol-disulfide oxidoreductase (DUF899 family)